MTRKQKDRTREEAAAALGVSAAILNIEALRLGLKPRFGRDSEMPKSRARRMFSDGDLQAIAKDRASRGLQTGSIKVAR